MRLLELEDFGLSLEDIDKLFSLDFIEAFIEENKLGIVDILLSGMGFSTKKRDLVPENEMKFFEFIVVKDFLNAGFLNAIEDQDDPQWSKSYIALMDFYNFNFDFSRVISQTESSLTLENIRTSTITNYEKSSPISYPEDRVIVALAYMMDGDFLVADNFVVLTDHEVDKIYDIFLDTPRKDFREIFIEEIVVGRLIGNYIDEVHSFLLDYEADLAENFSQDDLIRFYNHLHSLAKYLFYSDDGPVLYEVNFYEFLKGQCQMGNFVMEGDLESFIEIASHIMEIAAAYYGYEVSSLIFLKKAEENIFSLKQELTKNHPLTDLATINFIDQLIKEGSLDLSQFVMLSFFIENLAEDKSLELTVNNRIKLKSIRNFLEEFFTDFEQEREEFFQSLRILVDLAFAILLANDLIFIDENKQVFTKERLNFFLDQDPSVALANIIKGLFRVETFSHYLGKNKKTAEGSLKKTMEALKTNNFYNFVVDKKDSNIIELLKVLDLLRERSHQGEIYYELGPIGEFIQKQEIKKDKKAKILKLSDYK